MGDRFTCAVVTYEDGSKRHFTNVLRGGLSMSRRGACIALTKLDGSIEYLEGSHSVMMVDDHWAEEHADLLAAQAKIEKRSTPGPWWIDVAGVIVAGAPEHYRVIADTLVPNVPDPQRRANAELMVKALEMKVLLQQIVEQIQKNPQLREQLPATLLEQSEQLVHTLED